MSWVLENLFRRPSLNFILGPFGSKKTWLGLDLAVSVALGRGWQGFPGPQAPALFIDEEDELAGIRIHLRSVLLAHRAPIHTPIQFCSFTNFNFAFPRDVASLALLGLSSGAGLIVIDSPLSFKPFLDTSDPETIKPMFSSLLRVAQACSAAVIVLAHTRQRRTGLAPLLLSLGVNHVLAVDSIYGDPLIHLRTLAASGLDPVSITAEMHSSIHNYDTLFHGLAPSSAKPSPPLGQAGFAVLRYLAFKQSASTSEVMAAVTAAVPSRIRTLLHELTQDGFIRPIRPGKRGSPSLYELTKAGRCLT